MLASSAGLSARAARLLLSPRVSPLRSVRQYHVQNWKPSVARTFAVFATGSAAAFGGAVLYDATHPISPVYAERRFNPQYDRGIVAELKRMWNSLGTAKEAIAVMVAANAAIFLLWRVPAMHRILETHFVHHTASRRIFQLIGSSFSHHAPLHLGFNMLALWSFGPMVFNMLDTSQFTAFTFSAALASSLGTVVHSRLRGIPLAGLGISGIIMAYIGMLAVQRPDLQLGMILLPGSLGIREATMGIILFDLAGVVMGWRTLGHAAHLGGMFFGIFYAQYLQVPTFSRMLHRLSTNMSRHRLLVHFGTICCSLNAFDYLAHLPCTSCF
eukprot:m.124534 g.124534  ORF g.124534 m.124534 type:complete len:327 (+) comp9351_c0_seq1:60-1040(+)